MGRVSVRIPDDLETKLEAYIEEEQVDRSTAVRKLLAEGLNQWRETQVIEQFADGEVTFSRAAEMLSVSVWDFATIVKRSDLAWVGSEELEEVLVSSREACV